MTVHVIAPEITILSIRSSLILDFHSYKAYSQPLGQSWLFFWREKQEFSLWTQLFEMESIYSFISEGMDKRPAYGFSHRLRASVEKGQITPSPLDYHAEKVTLGTSARSFTFGHRPRTNYVVDYDAPGPGECKFITLAFWRRDFKSFSSRFYFRGS